MHLYLIRITLGYLHYNRAMPVCLKKIINYLRADALVLFIEVEALIYSKTCLRRLLKTRQKLGFLYQLSPNAGQRLQREHSAILSTFIKLSFVFKTFVLFNFEWPLKTLRFYCMLESTIFSHPGLKQRIKHLHNASDERNM